MKIYANDYTQDTLEKAESLLFNGNGFIGIRGNLEESYYDHFITNRETYINGFYETKQIHYPEKMYGFTETGETMISVVDGQTTLIEIGDERFDINKGSINDSTRYLDMEKGVTVRELIWVSPKGRQTRIKIIRLASFIHKNIFTLKYEFEKINHQEDIYLITHLNFYPIRTIDKKDPRMSHDLHRIQVMDIDLDKQVIHFQAPHSKMQASCFWKVSEVKTEVEVTEDRVVLKNNLTESKFIKTFSYLFGDQPHEGFDLSFQEHQELQKDYLTKFWNVAKVGIESDVAIEESVNFGTYSLLQSLGTSGTNSIAAKGLSGSGYGGHYFWDTEMYIYPVFLHFQPELAKQILRYRIHILEKARQNRELFGYQTGVLFPWRTISGIESSPFFEAGSAQHHINADIAYAFIRYYESTKETDLFFEGGFEVLLETARLFVEIGYVKGGKFHIDKVTGPDEYSVLVNDNYYTNVMVKHQFKWINKLARILKKVDGEKWHQLTERLKLSTEELNLMLEYAEIMEKPLDLKRQLIKQDRDFLNKEKWPFSKEEKTPLLLHYHPLVIYRYQVCKQADAVMALMLFPEEETQEVIKNSVYYYDEVTTHDSSLSYSAFSIVYNRIGDTKKSYQYFLENARCDLDNLHGNTKDGLHTAAMGGTLMNILYGFCDLTFKEEEFTLNPKLPSEIKSINFSMVYQSEIYRIGVTHENYSIVKENESDCDCNNE